jgi:CRISPR-associated protein Cmr1
MTKLEYTVRFVTPAFLGNAEQNGQWRTPPFKALLRQWWRVVYSADQNFNVDVTQMRREEGLLFGNAWLENEFRKSLVRLRLDRWDPGKETRQSWGRQELDKTKEGVSHPEVGTIGPKLYLGYGPLIVEKVQRQGEKKAQYATVLKNNAAIQAGEEAKLSVVWPTQHPSGEVQKILDANNQKRRIERALWLMHRYGTLGGRSRNGWGSSSLLSLRVPVAPGNATGDEEGCGEGQTLPIRPWRDSLALDWPHAIGKDDKGALIWQTVKAYGDWKTLMRDLAIVKIGLRTQFVFPNVRPPHATVEPRHWLSYPITTHTTQAWNRGARLPNSLRFKVRPNRSDPQKLRGVIFHVPHLPPSEFSPNRTAIERTWRAVHALLDEMSQPSGRSYAMIADGARRNALKPELDTVSLQRIPE